MTTGDLKNNLRKLHSELKLVNYAGELDIEGLSIGRPSAFLPLLHFVLTEFSFDLAQYFYSKDYELLGKSDVKFVQVVYRILRDEFNAKLPLTKEQFFTLGFAERKLQLVTLVLQFCRAKSEALQPKRRKTVSKLNPGKTSRSNPRCLQENACINNQPNSAAVSKECATNSNAKKVRTTTISDKTAKSPILTKISNNNVDGKPCSAAVSSEHVSGSFFHSHVITSEMPVGASCFESGKPRRDDVEGTSTQSEEAEGIPRSVTKTFVSHMSHNGSAILMGSKSSEKETSVSASSYSCAPQNECIQKEIHNFSVPKENIPPSIVNGKKLNIPEPLHGDNLLFSPIPVTYTAGQCCVPSQNNATSKKFELPSVTCDKGCAHSKHIYVNPGWTSSVRNVDPDNEEIVLCLEKLTDKHVGKILREYFKAQQERITQLEKDVRERNTHVQDLAKRNSDLSARVMVLETAVALMQEKIN